MHTLLTRALDILFPPSADMRIVRALTPTDVARLYAPRAVHDMTALSAFSDVRVRALIHEAKFHGSDQATSLLAHLVDEHLRNTSHHYDCIIPIPLSPARKRARGYNQVEEVLQKTHTSIPVVCGALIRSKNTRPQTDLDKVERLKNMHGAFAVKRPESIHNKSILLVDDVTTTGATLREAKAALLKHSPASVTCIAIAH